MKVISRTIFLGLWFKYQTHPRVLASGDEECGLNSTVNLWNETGETFGAMLSKFESICDVESECTGFRTPVRTLTVKNYDALGRDSNEESDGQPSLTEVLMDFNELYHDSCADRGMTMCYVSNTVRLNSNSFVDTDAIAATQVIRELNKPICFPNSCTEDQVELLNPYPTLCELAGNSCEILETKVECPEDRIPEGDNFYCEGENPGPLTTATINKITLYNSMDAKCAEVILGGSNTFCLVQHRWAEVMEFKDYSEFKKDDNSFQRFRTDCRKNGGQECFADFNLLRGVSLGPTAGINYNITGVDYPYCFPRECTESSLTQLAGDIILTNFGTTDLGGDLGVVNLCTLPNGGCFFGYNFYCGDRSNLVIQNEIDDASIDENLNENSDQSVVENNDGVGGGGVQNNQNGIIDESSSAIGMKPAVQLFTFLGLFSFLVCLTISS